MYVDTALRAMVDPWNSQKLINRAVPEMMRQGGDKYMQKLFTSSVLAQDKK